RGESPQQPAAAHGDLVSTVAYMLAVPLGHVALGALPPPASGLAGQVVAVGAQREGPPDFGHPLSRLPRTIFALLWQRPLCISARPHASAVARATPRHESRSSTRSRRISRARSGVMLHEI